MVSKNIIYIFSFTLTVSKGCPMTREASPPTPPANKFAPGDALSLSRPDLSDNSGSVARGGVVDLVQGGVVDLDIEAGNDLKVVGGDAVLLLSVTELVTVMTGGLVSACAMFVTLELAIATFISRIDGWVGKEQGHAPYACF